MHSGQLNKYCSDQNHILKPAKKPFEYMNRDFYSIVSGETKTESALHLQNYSISNLLFTEKALFKTRTN